MSRRRILLLFLSFLVALTGGTYFVLHKTGATRTFVQQLVGRVIHRDLFELGQTDLDLTAGRLTVLDFELKNPKVAEGPPLLSVGKIEVDLETNPLGEVGAIRKVTLDRLQINISLAPGETPQLDDILEAAGVKTEDTADAATPVLIVTNSTLRLSVAPNRPTITFRDLKLTLQPQSEDPELSELSGTMISPLGHEMKLQGTGNLGAQQFRAMLIAEGIPIKAEQAALFDQSAVDFLEQAEIAGTVEKTVLWMQVAPANANAAKQPAPARPNKDENGATVAQGPVFTAGVSADLRDLSAKPLSFPYAITGATGKVFATTIDGGSIKFQLDKKGVDGDFKVRGNLSGFLDGDASVDIELGLGGLLVSHRLQQALEAATLETIREIHTAIPLSAGRIDGKIQIYGRGESLDLSADFDLDGIQTRFVGFADASGQRIGFPCELNDIAGRVSVRPNELTITGVSGRTRQGGKISVDGQVTFNGDVAHPDFEILGERIEFSPEIRDALKGLLPDGDKIYDEYAPTGTTDITVRLRPDGNGDRFLVELRPLLAGATYQLLPYRLEKVRGKVTIANDGVWLDLIGEREAAKVAIDGRFLFGNEPGLHSELSVKATDLRFDSRLHTSLTAFSKDLGQLWDKIQPHGKLGCEFLLWQETKDAEFKYDVHLEVSDGSAELGVLPIPIEKLRGDIFLHGGGQDCRCDISLIRGEIDNGDGRPPAQILVQGTVNDTPAGVAIDLTAIAQQLRLTKQLGTALSKAEILDAGVWSDLALDGSVDVTALLKQKAGAADLTPQLSLRLRDVSSQAEVLPDRLHKLRGDVAMIDGQVSFDRLHGKLGETDVIAHSGSVQQGDLGTLAKFTINADSLPMDARLARALRGPVKKAYLDRAMSGSVKLDEVAIELRFPDAKFGMRTEFRGKIGAQDLFMDVGLSGGQSLRHLTGVVSVHGVVDEKGGTLTGSVDDLAFKLTKQQVNRVNSRFKLTPDRLTLHDLSFVLASGTVKSSRQDGLTLLYDFADRGKLSAFVTYHEVNLNSLLRDRGLGETEVRGTLSGVLRIDELIGNNFLDMRGGGEVLLTKGRLGQVPIFGAIYSHMKPEKRPQFTEGKVLFEIDKQRIQFNHLHADSDLIKIEGKGYLDMDGYMHIHMTTPGVFGNAADIFIVPTLIDLGLSKVFAFQVYGYIRNPKFAWSGEVKRPRIAPIGPTTKKRHLGLPPPARKNPAKKDPASESTAK